MKTLEDRAKKVAEVLDSCGWSISDENTKNCSTCGAETRRGARYCEQCGARLSIDEQSSAIDDIKAALIAAYADQPGESSD